MASKKDPTPQDKATQLVANYAELQELQERLKLLRHCDNWHMYAGSEWYQMVQLIDAASQIVYVATQRTDHLRLEALADPNLPF